MREGKEKAEEGWSEPAAATVPATTVEHVHVLLKGDGYAVRSRTPPPLLFGSLLLTIVPPTSNPSLFRCARVRVAGGAQTSRDRLPPL
jgi:hypothetical protein